SSLRDADDLACRRLPADLGRAGGGHAGDPACRPGGDLGIQLGGRWTEGTGQTENGLFVGGRLHKIHEELFGPTTARTGRRRG
ncbi:DUF2804 domain-containing protein, partial [uncultured Ornithinimicrobium sp.]